MCDFEDLDLNQARTERRKDEDAEWETPIVYTGESMEELGEDDLEAEESETVREAGDDK